MEAETGLLAAMLKLNPSNIWRKETTGESELKIDHETTKQILVILFSLYQRGMGRLGRQNRQIDDETRENTVHDDQAAALLCLLQELTAKQNATTSGVRKRECIRRLLKLIDPPEDVVVDISPVKRGQKKNNDGLVDLNTPNSHAVIYLQFRHRNPLTQNERAPHHAP